MQAAGVRAVVDQRSLAVVGIVEVIPHIPRILGELRKLVRACAAEPPGRGHPDRFPQLSSAPGAKAEAAGRAGGLPDRAAGLGLEDRAG